MLDQQATLASLFDTDSANVPMPGRYDARADAFDGVHAAGP